jgi:hypothetical protein
MERNLLPASVFILAGMFLLGPISPSDPPALARGDQSNGKRFRQLVKEWEEQRKELSSAETGSSRSGTETAEEPDPEIYTKVVISGKSLENYDVNVLELEKEHYYLLYRNSNSRVFSETGTPENGSMGPCNGHVEVWPDGNLRKEGYCLRQTPEGDKYYSRWWQDRSDPKTVPGNWELRGLTGRWEGAFGYGTYTWHQLQKPPNGQAENRYKGVVYFKKENFQISAPD